MTSMFFTNPLFYGREQISLPGEFCDMQDLRDINGKPVRNISSMLLSVEFGAESTLDVTIWAPHRKGDRPNRVIMAVSPTMRLVLHALQGIREQINMEREVISARQAGGHSSDDSMEVLRRYLDSAHRFKILAEKQLAEAEQRERKQFEHKLLER